MTAPSPKTNGNRVKTNAPNSPKNSSTAGGGGTNVRVVGRIRPLAGFEKEKGCKRAVSCMPGMDDGAPQLIGARDDDQKKEDGEQQTRWFELDAVFDETSTQQDVYVQSGAQRAVRQDLFRGFNCTILAYGQTGAGKTFTMGTANASGNNKVAALGDTDGVIPRCCVDLFRTIATKCDHRGASVELSYLEVYNEEIRDLLAAHEKDNATLRIRETPEGEVYVRGLQSRKVAGPADIGKLMEEASGRRVVASTKMNATSSRSHAICILRITGILAEDSSKFSAKLTLVDLAGSERIKKTGAGAARAKEGININKGLFVLGQVVSALSEQRPKLKRKPPYRDSKLTRLLQDSLGGNSRTIMVACVSPADFNLEESVNTLRYATTARNIKNTATRNVQKQISPEEFAKLQRENQLLKKEVAELQATIEKMQAHVSQEDLERSVRLLNEFSASQSQLNVNGTGSSFAPPPPPPPPPPAPSLAPAPPPAPLLMSSPLATNKKVSELDGAGLMSPSTAMEKEASMLQKSPVRSPNNRSLQSLLHLPDSAIHQQNRRDSLDSDGHDEVSLSLEQVMGAQMMQKHGSPKPTTKSSAKQPYNTKDKTREELELEVARLTLALDRAEHDVRSSLHESAVELPAAKMQLAVLEEELNASQMMAEEAVELQREVQELTADAAAARAAADQLSKMVSNSNHGDSKSNNHNNGNNKPIVEDQLLERQLRDFERLKSEESWVTLIVQILRTFKEEMRLLGDYFHMVVKVVDSKDILSMVPQSQRNKRRNKWFNNKASSENEMEIQLRKKLMSEHVQFYNARFLEMEDDVSGRSEFVDAILQGLCVELDAVEKGLLAVEDEEKEEDNDDENNVNCIQDRIDRIAQKQDRDSGELLYQLTKLLAGPPRERGATDSTDAHLERHYQNNHNHHSLSSSASEATAEAGAAATAEAKEVLLVDEETTTTAATKTTTTAAETTEADEAEVTEAAETTTLAAEATAAEATTAEATAAEATPAEATAAEATAAEATISEAEATPVEASSAGETTNSEVAETTTTTPPAEAATSVAETAPAEEEETTTAEEEATAPAEEEEEATTASGAETTSPAEAATATATASPSAASRLLKRWR